MVAANPSVPVGRRECAWGFTLFELMITVAIISILVSIAYPSYVSYVTRAKRTAAEGVMLEAANRQERYLLDTRGYAADMAALGMVIPNNVSANYTVTTTSPRSGVTTVPSYEVKAQPINGQDTRDAQCGTLTINEAGTKDRTGAASLDTCWKN